MPAEYIYAPWTAPLPIQQKAGCVVGVDYPAPIVDYQATRVANIKLMKAAYASQKATSDKTSLSKKRIPKKSHTSKDAVSKCRKI